MGERAGTDSGDEQKSVRQKEGKRAAGEWQGMRKEDGYNAGLDVNGNCWSSLHVSDSRRRFPVALRVCSRF